MYTATRRIQFCAGHRVHLHESKCNNLHGHNYVVFFHARPKKGWTLDTLGRVIDFSVLKQILGGWIDTNWDHGFIAYEKDMETRHVLDTMPGQKKFILGTNPTAENMAEYLLKEVCPRELHHTCVEVYKIVLWETENCFAEVTLE